MNIIKETLTEWYRYMDTTYPEGVNRRQFTNLKYTNRNKIRELTAEHDEIDKTLLEMVAMNELLSHSDEEILRKIGEYLE